MIRALRKYGAELSTVICIGTAIAFLQYQHWPFDEQRMGSGWDSGIFAYCGHVLAETHRLYAFCTDNKPPGIFLVNALASLAPVSGNDWRAIWVLTWLAQTVAWAGVGALASHRGKSGYGWLVAAVGAVSAFQVLDGAATVEIFSLPLQALATWAAYHVLSRPAGRTLGAGLIAGVAVGGLFVMRTNNIAAGVLVVGVFGVLLARGRRLNALHLLAGALIGSVATVLATLYLSGGVEAFHGALEFTLAQGVNYLGTNRESRLVAAVSNVILSGSLFALFVGAILLERSSAGRGTGSTRVSRRLSVLREPWLLLLALWMVCEIAFSTASARRYPHYAQMLLVPMALLLGELLTALAAPAMEDGSEAAARGHGRWTTFGRTLVVLTGCVLAVLPYARAQTRSFSEGVRERIYARRIADTLALGGARRDGVFLWGAPPAIYLFLGNAAPVRHIAPLTLATPGFSRPEYFTETIACLAGSAPAYIVDTFDSTTIGFIRGPLPTPTLEETPGFIQLRAFITRHYTFDRHFVSNRTALWRRTSSIVAMRDSSGVVARDCRPHPDSWRLHPPA